MTVSNKTNNRISTAFIGGVLSIVSAGISLLWIFGVLISEYIRYFSGDLPMFSGTTYFIAFGGIRIVSLIASILAIIGGIYAIKRKHWWIALVGAAFSLLCFPMIFGLTAIILVAISKNEFKTEENAVLER